MNTMKLARRATAAAALALSAASAWAQDYTVTTSSGLIEARPPTASALSITSLGAGTVAPTALPFAFPYHGSVVTDVTIAPYGFIVPRAVSSIPNANTPANPHGQVGPAFPYTQAGAGGAGDQNVDGVIAAAWSTQFRCNEAPYGGTVYTWTTGAAPSRHFVVCWDNAKFSTNANAPFTLQIHLYETTGRIVLAYSPAGTYATAYVLGIDSPTDARFTAPLAGGINNSGYPGGDFILDPRAVTYTGQLLYDKVVSDATGIGNSTLANDPLSALRVELRSGGVFASATTTAADGSFSITGLGVPATGSGSLSVLAQGTSCRVSSDGTGAATEWTVVPNLPFASGASLGTLTLRDVGDAGRSIRSALNVARTCQATYAWATPLTASTIPLLPIALDDTSAAATSYAPAGAGQALLRVAGKSASNPDAWDDGIVTRAYARHVLAAIAGAPTTAYDGRFDAVTDQQNAFAAGFGDALWGAISGTTKIVDGLSNTQATVYDLESPSITVQRGPDVAGSVGGALFDLVDVANETTDPVDGPAALDRFFKAADLVLAAPTVSTFLQAWITLGFGGKDVTRVLIAHKVLADDVSEPNDSPAEAAVMGPVGFVRTNLVLNRFNEDWYEVTLAADAAALAADAKYDPLSTGATVGVEIRSSAGALLATGTFNAATGAVHAVTGAVTAGTYRIGVQHVSGGTVPTYVFQAYVPPTLPAKPIADWTLGRDYDRTLGLVGGIPPFAATVQNSSLPPGLGLNSINVHAVGRPNAVGVFNFTVQVKDSGNPANTVQQSQTLVINDVLKLPQAPFLGFTADRPLDFDIPTRGGTPPFTLSMTTGSLPAGLSMTPGTLRVKGTAAAGVASTTLELDAVDVAGSADHVAYRAVVCGQIAGKNIPTRLQASVGACGWWFDAVQGSTVTFSVSTQKGSPRRILEGTFIGPDGDVVETGTIRNGTGVVKGVKLRCPKSGRYFFIVATNDNGLAATLLGTLTVAVQRSGKGSSKTYAPTDTTTIEIGALPDSVATVKFTGDKRATLVAKVVSVIDPTGAPVPFAGFIKANALGGTMTLPMPQGGTWKIVLGANTTSGVAGKFSYSFTVKPKKGAVFVAP